MREQLLSAAEIVDAWRVVPRLMLALYGLMCWHVADWFMHLPEPSGTQAAFVSTIWGGAAAWFGLYVRSGPSGPQQRSSA